MIHDGDSYSTKWKVNSGSWYSAPNNGTTTIPASAFTIGQNRVYVRATDVRGKYGETYKDVTDYAVPNSAPGSLSPSSGQQLEIQSNYQFFFSGVSYADHYQVIIDDNSNFASPVYNQEVAGSGFTVSSSILTSGKTYYWKICGENVLGTQGPWRQTNFSIKRVNNPPIVSMSLDQYQISHGWNVELTVASHDPEEDNYSTKWKVDSGSWNSAPNDGTTTIPASAFTIGQNRVYVRATDIYGLYGETYKDVTDYAVPNSAPGSLSPSSGQQLEIQSNYEFIFGGVPYADNYQVIIDDNSNFASPVYNQEVAGSGFTVGDDKLTPGKTYYWKICGENVLGTQGPWAQTNFSIESLCQPGTPPPNEEMGVLVETCDVQKIYWVKYSKKWHILNPAILAGLAYPGNAVQKYVAGALDSFAVGKNILEDNKDFLYRSENNPDVFLINQGKSRSFVDWDALSRCGYEDSDIYWATDQGASWIKSTNNYPVGLDITGSFDFTVTVDQIPGNADLGGTIPIKCTVNLTGDPLRTDKFVLVYLYLSKTPNTSTGPDVITICGQSDGFSFDNLDLRDGTETKTKTITFTSPNVKGQWYVVAKVDGPNFWTETNENNNLSSSIGIMKIGLKPKIRILPTILNFE